MRPLPHVLLLWTLVLASCASGPKPRTELLAKQQSFALISFFARNVINPPPDASLTVSMAVASQRGNEPIAPRAAEHAQRLTEVLKGAWKPVEEVVKAPSYAKLPDGWDSASFTGLLGTRPLHLEKPKEMGAFAKELGVDAVVLVRHEYALGEMLKEQLHQDTVGISRFYAIDRVTTLVISNTGETLYESTVDANGPNPKLENAGTAALDLFSAPPTPAVLTEALAGATTAGIDAALRDLAAVIR